MKTVVLHFDDKHQKYKFPVDATVGLIDETIRDCFKLPKDNKYRLIDMQDTSLINISSLRHLNNESAVLIQLDEVPNSSTYNYSNTASG